jgi:7-keto-8-aminopelargonate synthetase-like enzyme
MATFLQTDAAILYSDGASASTSTIAAFAKRGLREIVALKKEFGYRLILDDSHAMGVLGGCGRGSLEKWGLKPMRHCEILTFSIENAFRSVGGVTVGSEGECLFQNDEALMQTLQVALVSLQHLYLYLQQQHLNRGGGSSKIEWSGILLPVPVLLLF